MVHFYCKRLTCGDFSIDYWNERFNHHFKSGTLETEQADRELHPEKFPCEEQCFDCIATIGERRLKTKLLS